MLSQTSDVYWAVVNCKEFGYLLMCLLRSGGEFEFEIESEIEFENRNREKITETGII